MRLFAALCAVSCAAAVASTSSNATATPTPATVRALAARLRKLSAQQLSAGAVADSSLDDAAATLGVLFAGAGEHDASPGAQREIAQLFYAYYSAKSRRPYTNATAAARAAAVPAEELAEAHAMLTYIHVR